MVLFYVICQEIVYVSCVILIVFRRIFSFSMAYLIFSYQNIGINFFQYFNIKAQIKRGNVFFEISQKCRSHFGLAIFSIKYWLNIYSIFQTSFSNMISRQPFIICLSLFINFIIPITFLRGFFDLIHIYIFN